MNISCNQCGKMINGEDIAFCPYCGAKLNAAGNAPETANAEAEKWVRKAKASSSYPERKKILLNGLEACPESREIAWELLFIGEEGPKKGISLDFSIIKSWNLEIYRKPGDFSSEKRDRMREQLFDAPELIRTLNRFDNPKDKQREYLQRLCREYIELFLEGNSQVMGYYFGFHIERNKGKKLAVPVAEMIERIRTDEKLSPEQREQLWKALYQGYAARMEGKTECLDEYLADQS